MLVARRENTMEVFSKWVNIINYNSYYYCCLDKKNVFVCQNAASYNVCEVLWEVDKASLAGCTLSYCITKRWLKLYRVNICLIFILWTYDCRKLKYLGERMYCCINMLFFLVHGLLNVKISLGIIWHKVFKLAILKLVSQSLLP